MKTRTKILIADTSVIIRRGLISVLQNISTLSLDIDDTDKMDDVFTMLNTNNIDILVVNPIYFGGMNHDKIKAKAQNPCVKIIAIVNGVSDPLFLKQYDSVINIGDSLNQIQDKLESLIINDDESGKTYLSIREQEIVKHIALGLSNKEIADVLFLSTHTVTTHRRNIMNKLHIHSSAGLTIYAIVNKIVDISDVAD